MPRSPRIARPPGARWSSVLLATLLAALGAGAAVATARARDAHAVPGPTLADGVRRLRAAVVGDVRDADVRDADDFRVLPPGLAARALPRAVRRGARVVIPPPAPPPDDAARDSATAVWTEHTTPARLASAGDTVTLPTPDLPAALPAALRARGVRWEAEGAVTLLGGGRAVLDAPGNAAITAVTPAGRTRTPLAVRPAVRGQLYAAGPGDDDTPPPARVIVRRGAAPAETTWTDAAGRFRLTLPPGDAAPADVRVEPAASAPAYAPVVLRALPPERLHTLGVVLLPARWTIEAGGYAGATVPVRAAAARGFWHFTREPREARGRPVGWLRDAPHTVALAPGFDPADSATFWRAARALGAAWGRTLFVPYTPGRGDTAVGPDGTPPDIEVRPVPGLLADGFTSLGWDGTGALASATIEFRARGPGALAPIVAEHELLHALGFGHARGWASVLAPAGRTLAPGATAEDVAYGQLHDALVRQARRAEAAYGAAYGWPDAAP